MAPDDFVWWIVASAAAIAFNLPLGQLRGGTPRHSSRWFACLMAPIFLLAAGRAALALPWAAAVPLLFAAVVGQAVGRNLPVAARAPSALRWRLAVYAALLAGLLLLIGPPVRAHDPHKEGSYWHFAAEEPSPSFSLVDQDGGKASLAVRMALL